MPAKTKPLEIRIAARTWQIERVKQIVDPRTGEVDTSLDGVCDNRLGKIQVAADLCRTAAAEVVAHEAIHAMLSLVDHEMNMDEEEALVVKLTPIFHALLHQNDWERIEGGLG